MSALLEVGMAIYDILQQVAYSLETHSELRHTARLKHLPQFINKRFSRGI